jgi:FlaA1/EpsC-like NDP-sugar epimerase
LTRGAGDVSVEALLGRKVVNVGAATFGDYLAGAAVLVTGAGGSIGAELCARLAQLGVRQIVLVDQAEAPLLAAARSLERSGFAACVPVLADIRSRSRTLELFEGHRPDIVFHAAAYKHVPLLEDAPVEAVATNILGTQSVVDASRLSGVERFVVFSTDKAVRPASILGRTKRVAELIVAGAAQQSYGVVRLGNVIDSSGSCLPLFREQLADGRPLTVTDRRATRYLMTAGEAAGLAVVAGALVDSQSVFFLDTGPPVSVLDLAGSFAGTAAGHEIEFVGLRAGERLHEHMCWPDEEPSPTPCRHVLRAPMHRVDPAWLERQLTALDGHVQRASAAGVRGLLAEMQAEAELERPREVVTP